jgi:hypothetical protein
MDDLLASIRRAIHDEGLDFTDPGQTASVIPLQEGAENVHGERNDRPRPRRPEPVKVDANEIAALRSKISRELNRDSSAPVLSVVPTSRPKSSRASAQGPSVFKSLLGGKEAVLNSSSPGTPSRTAAERSIGTDRPAAGTNTLRRHVPAPPVRPLLDPPSHSAKAQAACGDCRLVRRTLPQRV